MITVNVKNKVIDTSKLASFIVEDTHDVDVILFHVDEDISSLNIFMLYTNTTGEGYVDLLEKTEGDYIWKPSHRATVEAGATEIQLIGLDFDGAKVSKRWSSLSATIDVHRNIEAEELIDEPSQSLIENEICGGLE